MITFNAESIKQVETSSIGLFDNLKGMFTALGAIVEGCGDNPAAEVLQTMGYESEKLVNDDVLPKFMDLRAGITSYVSNIEEWEAKCGRMDPVNMSAVQSAEVTNNVKPVEFK